MADGERIDGYQELARIIIQNAVDDVQCKRTVPKMWCSGDRRRTSCPACREMAMMFLQSDWGCELADGVGIDRDAWEVAVRHLSATARENNALCYERRKAEAGA